jgi:patatin-like phospholipase/acyl hydrolase
LDEIMQLISKAEGMNGQLELFPCEYFDLICGSGFGGIVALMLGQLKMVPKS